MLKWFFVGFAAALFLALGWGIMYLVYGKRGMEARKKLGYSNKGPAIFLAVLLAFETFFGGLYLGLTPPEDIGAGNIFLLLIIPICILLWAITTRVKLPRLLSRAAAGPNDQDEAEAQLPVPDGGWRCTCGKVHAAYVSTCVCGVNKRDIPRNQ